jgi:hypothetical protein
MQARKSSEYFEESSHWIISRRWCGAVVLRSLDVRRVVEAAAARKPRRKVVDLVTWMGCMMWGKWPWEYLKRARDRAANGPGAAKPGAERPDAKP